MAKSWKHLPVLTAVAFVIVFVQVFPSTKSARAFLKAQETTIAFARQFPEAFGSTSVHISWLNSIENLTLTAVDLRVRDNIALATALGPRTQAVEGISFVIRDSTNAAPECSLAASNGIRLSPISCKPPTPPPVSKSAP